MKHPLTTGQIGKRVYSSIGFVMLGAIIESITGTSYIDALRKYILRPCKMNHTDIGNANITIYNNDEDIEQCKQKDISMEKHMVNAGGIYSCIHDTVRFAKCIPKLLLYEQLCTTYAFKDNVLSHGGFIYGGSANFKATYTNNKKKFKLKRIIVELTTCTQYNY
jgi:CubicO group peptidase (beta-lactamase class C family)